tara:strand:+ start:35 stop:247 length:213 start_codon:yes stop_codon:yes gene_type:complete
MNLLDRLNPEIKKQLDIWTAQFPLTAADTIEDLTSNEYVGRLMYKTIIELDNFANKAGMMSASAFDYFRN